MERPQNYGLPYMGSKNSIVGKFFPLFPKAKHFYDLFGGGGAVTHYAVLSAKYEQVHYNDISDIGSLFEDAVSGKYANETRWISREDFYALKDKEPYVRVAWSFGNNGENYMYSREVEPWKRALHYARVFGDCSEFRKIGIETDGTRRDIIKNMPEYKQKYIAWYVREVLKNDTQSLESLQRLQRLQSLESLERLQSLQSLQRLQTTQKDYRKITIKPNSVIYCDIPYRGTCSYDGHGGGGFDYEEFYDWANSQTEPIFISEYSLPDNRFECIYEQKKRGILSATANNLCIERIFVPKKQHTRLHGVQMSLF